MNWMYFVLVVALAAFATWIACQWWYGRKLRQLKKQVEQDLPTVPPCAFSPAPKPPSAETQRLMAAPSIELLEQLLGEAEAKWHPAGPFLDTSPLTHEVVGQTGGMGDGEPASVNDSGNAPSRTELLHHH